MYRTGFDHADNLETFLISFYFYTKAHSKIHYLKSSPQYLDHLWISRCKNKQKNLLKKYMKVYVSDQTKARRNKNGNALKTALLY